MTMFLETWKREDGDKLTGEKNKTPFDASSLPLNENALLQVFEKKSELLVQEMCEMAERMVGSCNVVTKFGESGDFFGISLIGRDRDKGSSGSRHELAKTNIRTDGDVHVWVWGGKNDRHERAPEYETHIRKWAGLGPVDPSLIDKRRPNIMAALARELAKKNCFLARPGERENGLLWPAFAREQILLCKKKDRKQSEMRAFAAELMAPVFVEMENMATAMPEHIFLKAEYADKNAVIGSIFPKNENGKEIPLATAGILLREGMASASVKDQRDEDNGFCFATPVFDSNGALSAPLVEKAVPCMISTITKGLVRNGALFPPKLG